MIVYLPVSSAIGCVAWSVVSMIERRACPKPTLGDNICETCLSGPRLLSAFNALSSGALRSAGDLEKYPTIGYQPVYGRCNFAPIKTPIKMIVKLIEDFFKFYVKNGIEKTDSEKYAHISEVLEDLPYWSEKGKKKIDRMSGGS